MTCLSDPYVKVSIGKEGKTEIDKMHKKEKRCVVMQCVSKLVCIAGKGAFGQVFMCKNKIDGGTYAIKKIEFSSENYDTVMRYIVIIFFIKVSFCDSFHFYQYFPKPKTFMM